MSDVNEVIPIEYIRNQKMIQIIFNLNKKKKIKSEYHLISKFDALSQAIIQCRNTNWFESGKDSNRKERELKSVSRE